MKVIDVPEAEQKRVVTHCPFELKAVGEDGTFTGYGATFGNVDLGGDICDAKCFDETIMEHKSHGTMPHMFFSHNINEPIGDYLDWGTDAKGLLVSGKLWIGQGIPKAQQAYNMLKSKTGKGLSIGYQTQKYTIDEKAGTRRLLKVRVGEISPTAFPMNERAEITAIKTLLQNKDKLDIREAEEVLREAGFSHSGAKHFLALFKAGMRERWEADRALLDACKNLERIVKG